MFFCSSFGLVMSPFFSIVCFNNLLFLFFGVSRGRWASLLLFVYCLSSWRVRNKCCTKARGGRGAGGEKRLRSSSNLCINHRMRTIEGSFFAPNGVKVYFTCCTTVGWFDRQTRRSRERLVSSLGEGGPHTFLAPL